MDEQVKTSIAQRLARQVAEAHEQQTRDPTPVKDGESDGGDNVMRHILPGQHLARIPLGLISPAPEGQAREDFKEDRLQTLAGSLKRSGVREPIIVTPHGAEPGRFQIVAGERRWRAAKLAGLSEIPCIVDPGLKDRKEKLLAQAEENLHRENLNPVEEAAVLAQLMEERKVDAREAGELIGKSQRQARRLLQLHTAAAPIKRAVICGQLDPRAALEMVRIFNRLAREDPSPASAGALRRIEKLIERFVREQWPIRRLERFAARALDGGSPGEQPDATGSEGDPSAKAALAIAMRPRGKSQSPEPSSVDVNPGTLVVRKGGQLLIDVNRIEQRRLEPEEREALIALLEDLLHKVRHR